MLYNSYDLLIDKVIENRNKIVEKNSVDKLALGYRAAKKFLEEAKKWRKKDLTESILADIERCRKYCGIIDELRKDNL